MIVWVVVAVVLFLVELRHLAFYALFGAVGSLAAAIVAAVAPSAVPLQLGVAVGVAGVGTAGANTRLSVGSVVGLAAGGPANVGA